MSWGICAQNTVPIAPEEGIGFPGAGVTSSSEPLKGLGWELNLGP